MRWLDHITDSMDMSLSKLWGVGDGQGNLVCCSPWGSQRVAMTEQLNQADPISCNLIEKINLMSIDLS